MSLSSLRCHNCDGPLTLEQYRIVGIELGTYRSVYACSAACEQAIRSGQPARNAALPLFAEASS